jgi:DNA polymerase-3 subunit gamma/tau
MSYIVLARKYRPQNFLQLKGQEVLVQTITNAFLHNKLHHAYLLTGIRGIGKTTTARIIAKTLNCSNLKTTENNLIPCEECANCLSVKNGSHPDILEFDAASHTGIEDIKNMLDGVSYSPALGRYRVFIVDEIHMLSTKAFNSLLKTLEEPPTNVIFIFATTEIQKVPVTILSRCQKFSLMPLSIEEMANHLASVANLEKIKITQEALCLIAVKSGGSVRDALSILDQTSMSASNKEITKDAVQKMLSIVSKSEIEKLYGSVTNAQTTEVLAILRQIKTQGVSEASILEEFLEYLYEQIQKRIHNHEYYSNLLRLWNIFLPATHELTYAFNKYAILEIIFIKAMHIYSSPSVENLVHSISENKIIEILKEFPDAHFEKVN